MVGGKGKGPGRKEVGGREEVEGGRRHGEWEMIELGGRPFLLLGQELLATKRPLQSGQDARSLPGLLLTCSPFGTPLSLFLAVWGSLN